MSICVAGVAICIVATSASAVAPGKNGQSAFRRYLDAKQEYCPDDGYPSFSPDSKVIALVQATGKVRQDSSGAPWIEHSALALVRRDGTGRHVIYEGTAFSGDLEYPVFSPDGKQLVFERRVSGFAQPSGKRAVFVVGIDGTHVQRVTRSGFWESAPDRGPRSTT
jgi:Tol biopolymer transport system component